MSRDLVLAVASGKGGTGKTTVATSLAVAAGGAVRFLDCDVEEPNAHIFLKPRIEGSEPVGVQVPRVDWAKCTACGKCAEVCQYNAIAVIPKREGQSPASATPSGGARELLQAPHPVLIFAELCHGCGACAWICPERAIDEELRPIGVLERGRSGSIEFVQGRLNVGEAMSVPLIEAVRASGEGPGLTVIDAPPGTSCPVIAAVRGTDLVVLVTEPTPFGLNDLKLAVEMVHALGLPAAVVINRADVGDARTREYCAARSIPLLAEIPDDRRVAEAYSRGEMPVGAVPEYGKRIRELLQRIEGCRA